MFEQLKADIKKALESKKQNAPQKLLSVIKNNPTKVLSAKEWNEILNKKFPKIIKNKLKNRPVPSTRRNLAGLEDNDVISRVGKKGSRGVKYTFSDDRDDGIWYKKLLKTGTTTENKWGKTSLKIEIYTFEHNDEIRYQSLLNAAFNGLLGTLDSIDEAGYSSEQVSATDVETLYVTDFSMDNPDVSWAFLKVDEWANKTDTGRVELYEA